MNFYIYTIGCQMNVYDSELIAGSLESIGHKKVDTVESADLVLVNTCCVREKAEQKAFSFLGRVTRMKRLRPNLIVGMGGCLAQQEGQKVFERMPLVDLVFGTHSLERLPMLIRKIEAKRCQLADTALSGSIFENSSINKKRPKVSEFITVMQGCDNFCTYCVVPYVRGREMSRKPQKILDEIRRLTASGVREVTLLGQNVNSYGKKECLCSFAELIHKINEISGLNRIRFTTSHPKDLSQQLINAFKNCSKLCPHIHLPVQSGSDKILKRMNRKYTRGEYEDKILRLREACPDIAVTSDFIVGFPGETSQDFMMTMDLIRWVQYDSLFAFKYSHRPNTPARKFSYQVSENEKSMRLKQLFKFQKEMTLKKNLELVGSVQPILVEGTSKKQQKSGESGSRKQWSGRTPANKVVNFSVPSQLTNDNLTGKLVDVRIINAFSNSLWGKMINP